MKRVVKLHQQLRLRQLGASHDWAVIAVVSDKVNHILVICSCLFPLLPGSKSLELPMGILPQ